MGRFRRGVNWNGGTPGPVSRKGESLELNTYSKTGLPRQADNGWGEKVEKGSNV